MLSPQAHRYYASVGLNHVAAIVLFGFDVNVQDEMVANNFIATAYLKHMRSRGS
jgi:hypothetical protein